VTAVALLALIAAAAGWQVMGRERHLPQPEEKPPEGGIQLAAEHALADAQRLLRFDGYRAGTPAATDWPRWSRDAAVLLEDLRELAGDRGSAGRALLRDLSAAERSLVHLRDRAALLGLTGETPTRPAVLRLPLDLDEKTSLATLRQDVRRRLELLREHYPNFQPEPLPPSVPLGVAEELHASARVNHDKLLRPVREEIRARVLRLGEGQETPAAWKELAAGWLFSQAENELAEWLALTALLDRIAGQSEPADPLTELGTFLRRDAFALPLERLTLVLPEAIDVDGQVVRGLRPGDGSLSIQHRTERGVTTVVNLHPMAADPLVLPEPGRHRYGVSKQNPLQEGRLVFRPGDQISARVAVVDADGKSWLLSWPHRDSPSAVYSFAVLTQAPRLHTEEQTDPTKGPIAFGARLIPAEPDLLVLPPLLPR
jgi:hypothetical protein